MHSVMFEPIGIERCGILEVEHWTTAPDIEALAIAATVLENIVPDLVIVRNANGPQGPGKTRNGY
jgi:hypothetical protein